MALRELQKSEWQEYFETVSRHLPVAEVEIDVARMNVGDQPIVTWTRLGGITYDSHSDVLEVVTDSLDHMIQKPQSIYVDDGREGLHAVQVIDEDGTRQIIQLRVPVKISFAVE